MKRTFLFALVGVIALAFASCGEGQSKEFTDKSEKIENLTKDLAGITSCEGLVNIVSGLDALDKPYDSIDKMKENEEPLLKEAIAKLQKAIDDKKAELGGCVEEPETPETPQVQLDENGNPILDAAEAGVEQVGEAVQEGVENVVNEVKDAIQG